MLGVTTANSGGMGKGPPGLTLHSWTLSPLKDSQEVAPQAPDAATVLAPAFPLEKQLLRQRL